MAFVGGEDAEKSSPLRGFGETLGSLSHKVLLILVKMITFSLQAFYDLFCYISISLLHNVEISVGSKIPVCQNHPLAEI